MQKFLRKLVSVYFHFLEHSKDHFSCMGVGVGGGGVLNEVFTGTLCPEVQLLKPFYIIYSCTIFDRRDTPSVYASVSPVGYFYRPK